MVKGRWMIAPPIGIEMGGAELKGAAADYLGGSAQLAELLQRAPAGAPSLLSKG